LHFPRAGGFRRIPNRTLTMSNLITANVLRHLAWQVAAAAITAAVAAIGHVDYSSLGLYAPLAQSAAALLGSIVNEWLSAAPKA